MLRYVFQPSMFLTYMMIHSLYYQKTGVTNVVTDLEAKTVVVDHDESVTPAFLLEKLLKVRLSPRGYRLLLKIGTVVSNSFRFVLLLIHIIYSGEMLTERRFLWHNH